jgi:DNA replication protein DnaC
MDREKIYNMFKHFDNHSDDYLGAMFINLFNNIPWCYKFFYNNDGNLQYIESYAELERYKFKHKIDTRQLLLNLIKEKENYCYEVFPYSSNEYLVCGSHPYDFMFNITTSGESSCTDVYIDIYVEQGGINDIFDNIIKPNCTCAERNDKLEFGIAALMEGTSTLYTSWFDYNVNIDINVKDNYNDDLPYDKMCEILSDDKHPDLMLFYGEPGTGKTSLIKHLIKKFNEKSFIFIDGGLLGSVQQDKLMTYFLDNWDTVFILEDCEKILKDRESGYNPVMPVLLNITDGIVGDVLKTKFICTFNSSLSKIDKALLRKGRLSLKYEFKKLDKEKVNKILPGENKDMTLADIYYKEEENDFSKTQKNKIGF